MLVAAMIKFLRSEARQKLVEMVDLSFGNDYNVAIENDH